MKVIGITGGIGSGKTTVCNFLELLGIPVYYADFHAKVLTDDNAAIRNAIIKLWGEKIYVDGRLDRKSVAEIVFKQPHLLSELNSIIHPVVKEHFALWAKRHAKCAFVVKEAAILFESGSYSEVDAVITVTAPTELRIDRIIRRDSLSREQILERFRNQWPDDKKISMSDYVINCNERELVIPQVLQIVTKLSE